ncbi:tRNA dihydrouridine synthase DusB [Haloimpatiens lingqiaonensis]|uniref:tRNA dihydrouridine synthase DusB n=1 Tax=Haloimpatiens lingqiaonensis TaxID=1380675 RepID=UPI0010FE1D61|nr:tRNA dihydrouridine synthase DusB [Haloimpatiens lingqiaonensis]
MKIGNLDFPKGIFLAPMAGVTDVAFRELCKEMGCELVYTEMISAKGMYYGSENTGELLKISKKESPVGVQIFGSEPYIMAKAAETFNHNDDICLVDINMGCPVPKIVKNGEGSALMKNPKLAAEIVREVRKASSKPVTVKFRKGFDSNSINAVEFGKYMEEAGAYAVTVHGRTRQQMYTGEADWDIIREVKENISIPVIGNGDIFSAEDVESIKRTTKCDGIMIARGVMGNPWIFREVAGKLQGMEVSVPNSIEKIDMCIEHLKRAIYYHGERKAVREMRKHLAWYIKGLNNCTAIKDIINRQEDSENVFKILKDYKEYMENR